MNYPNMEWKQIHIDLGCDGCRYCDKKALSIKPCCTWPKKLQADHSKPSGKMCLTRKPAKEITDEEETQSNS